MPPKKAQYLSATSSSALLDQAGDAIFVHDLVDGVARIVYVNSRACEMLGYTRDELNGKTLPEISADYSPIRAEELWKKVQAGEPAMFDTHLKRKDSVIVPVETSLSALKSSDGTYYLGIVRDISNRRGRDQVYRHLVESMNDAALVLDKDGRFIEVNERAVELLGYPRSALLSMAVSDLAEDVEPETVKATLAEALAGRPQIQDIEHRTSDGRVIPLEASISATSYLGQEAVLSLVRDITHRKEVEESLLRLSQRNQAILQTIPDIIAEVDENKVYTWANQAALDFFGADMIGREAAEFFVGPQNTYALVEPMFSGDSEYEYLQSWQRRSDGENRLLAWWCRTLRDPNGQVTGALSTARDITELRHEQAMKDSRLRILESAPRDTVEDFLQNVLRELEILTSSPVGFCNFMTNDGELFTAAAWAAMEGTASCEIEAEGVHHIISKAGVWADCARQRRPIVYNDFSSVSGRKGTPPGHTELTRILTVPVFRSDKIVAVFALGNKPSDYTDRDVETVETFVDLAWHTVARKQAETALQESDNRNRNLFDSSPHPVFLADPSGHFLDCNQTAVDTYGYSREELLEMSYRELAAPSLRAELEELPKGEYGERGSVFEWRHMRKDGTELPVEIKTATFTVQGKKRIISTVRDLTESKAAEEALRKSEERFKSLASMTKEGILIHEAGVIVDANRALSELMGFADPDELVGKPGLDLLPVSEETRAMMRERMRRGGDEVYEIELIGPDGSARWAVTGASDIIYQGRPARLVFMRDITDSKAAAAERARLQEQLQQAAKMESIGRLAGGVAHDFNNMLAVILGHAELGLERAAEDDPLKTDLLEIRTAAEHSARITQQLLAFARRQIAAPKVIDLSAAIEGTFAMLGRLIGERVTLAWHPCDDACRIAIDPAQLDQILVNLCLNARDAITGAGQVSLSTTLRLFGEEDCRTHDGCSPGEYVILSVEDDGEGMTPEAIEHMFEPFFTTKEVGEGTGLGLATVYGIVRQNSGCIDVVSSDRGTKVSIAFPSVDAPLSGTTSKPSRDTAVRGNETLLVIEDEPSVLRLATRILANLGYQVLAADTPTQALSLARDSSEKIALAITDVVMPEMTGWDLSKQLRASLPSIKTLFVSGYTDDVLAEDDHFDHDIDFLQKPFTPQQLAEAVRTALDRESEKL